MSEKLLNNIIPSVETIVLSPNSGSLQKIITMQLAALTECTPTELGYQGSAAWFNNKTNTKMIVSRFDYDKVVKKSRTGFNSSTEFIPALEKLNGFFFYGDLSNYVYDVDEDSNYIVFKWHMDIMLAYLTDTSMLDESFKIKHKVVAKADKKKDKRDDHVPMMLLIERAYRQANNDRIVTFCTEEIEEYFRRLIS